MVEYTIDDIRGPTVAREMAQLKTFVLEKFNGAIADAEAAAAAAAQAVLDSLDTRVGVLEGDMTTVQGAILTLDGAVVKLAGTQTITGTKNVPLEATGTASNQIASSQKVKNELDNYAPMVRTSGNQTIAGTKTFTSYPKGIGPVSTSINDQQTPNHVLICKFQGLFNGANMRIIVDTIHGKFVITASYFNGFTLNAYFIGTGSHAYTDVHIYEKDGDYYLIIDNSVWNTTFRAFTEYTGNFGQTQNYDLVDYSVIALLANLDDYSLSVTAGNGGTIA